MHFLPDSVFLLDIFQKRPLEFGLSAAGEIDEGIGSEGV